MKIVRFVHGSTGSSLVRAIVAAGLILTSLAVGARAQSNIVGGFGRIVQSNLEHPATHNIYDQVLLTGPSITVAADLNQIVRVSFVDENDDIVQAEFAGSGTMTIDLDPLTYRPPAPPAKYVQPGITYVTGRATIRVRNAGPNTFVGIFSVGRGNSGIPSLFPEGMTYDSMADIQMVQVDGAQLGAILTGNVRYSADSGATGIHAPATLVRHRVIVGEITARNDAVPLLRLGDGSSLDWDAGAALVAGGRLVQLNRTPLDVSSSSGAPLLRLQMVDGTLSSGTLVPAANLGAQLASRNGGAVTVNGIPHATRGFIPASFGELIGEAGFNTFDFGEGVQVQFSGGNIGTYSIVQNTSIEGILFRIQVTGTYSYVVAGVNQNQMTFVLTYSSVSASSAYGSFSGTIHDLAREAGEPLPVRITAVADYTSSTSGSATVTLLYTNGAQESATTDFDLERELDFTFL